MATCNDCIHKDVCYLIEHYGRDLCSDDVCDKFLATPVRHGHWVKEKPDVLIHWHCSVCENCYYLEESNADYCPRCGAKMGGNEVE